MSCAMISTTYLGACTSIRLLIETCHLIIPLVVPSSYFRRNSKKLFLSSLLSDMHDSKNFSYFPFVVFSLS